MKMVALLGLASSLFAFDGATVSNVQVDVGTIFRDANFFTQPSYVCKDSSAAGVFLLRSQIDQEIGNAKWRPEGGGNWETEGAWSSATSSTTNNSLRFYFNIDNARDRVAYQAFMAAISSGKPFNFGYFEGTFCAYLGYRISYFGTKAK